MQWSCRTNNLCSLAIGPGFLASGRRGTSDTTARFAPHGSTRANKTLQGPLGRIRNDGACIRAKALDHKTTFLIALRSQCKQSVAP